MNNKKHSINTFRILMALVFEWVRFVLPNQYLILSLNLNNSQ